MSPDDMNRLGLWLSFFSGLLLIPEIANLIPSDWLEKKIEKSLGILEDYTNFPQKLHPQSWQKFFSEEGRKKYIEPITAILGFVSSATWIITILMGVLSSSKFLIVLGFFLPVYISFERIFQVYGFKLSIFRFILLFATSVFISLTIAPIFSLIRILLLPIQAVIVVLRNYFTRHHVVRSMILIVAIVMFVLSNIFQLLASY